MGIVLNTYIPTNATFLRIIISVPYLRMTYLPFG